MTKVQLQKHGRSSNINTESLTMTTMQIQNTVEMTELSRVLLNTLQVILQND